jgi:hypothetical protein
MDTDAIGDTDRDFAALTVTLEAAHAQQLVAEATAHLRAALQANTDIPMDSRLHEAVEDVESAGAVLRFILDGPSTRP